MIYADDVIERNHLVLRNLNTNSNNTASDTWSGALTGYGFYSVPYEVPLITGHVYYCRFTYKYTTTSANPTWVGWWIQGGSVGTNTKTISAANTEYTHSCLGRPGMVGTVTMVSGNFYQGPSGNTTGVSGYVKNVMVYDVTELYAVLKTAGTATTDAALLTWCDNNLVHKPRYVNYDITDKVSVSTDKLCFDKGRIVAEEFVEGDGMGYYSVNTSIRDNAYFDSGAAVSIYGTSQSGGTVAHARIAANTITPLSPFAPKHATILKITTSVSSSSITGAGGFVCYHTSKANGIFVEKFVALIPTGYTVKPAYNGQGTGSSVTVLGNATGTGKWEEYTILYKCGTEGTFSTGGHVYLTGPTSTSAVIWYVAYVNNCDITGKEYLKGYTTLPKKFLIGGKTAFANEFNTRYLVPNGNLFNQEAAMLPSGWSYDTTDYAGESKCSLVQPVNAGVGNFGTQIPINPTLRYKISFWVKCKGDMTSYLVAIYYYTSNGTLLNHTSVNFKSGTKTQLSAALNTGDTTVTLKSGSNWAAKNYSRLGFRSNGTVSWNNTGISNSNGSTGMVKSVSGNVVTLNVAYSGSTMAVNTYVVESYDGSNYAYPIGKGALPTDNTWKYVEGYFGKADTLWDGNDNIGAWGAIPADAVKATICLNMYQNTGTVPIKFSDIRVEPVAGSGCYRKQDKIQIGG